MKRVKIREFPEHPNIMPVNPKRRSTST